MAEIVSKHGWAKLLPSKGSENVMNNPQPVNSYREI